MKDSEKKIRLERDRESWFVVYIYIEVVRVVFINILFSSIWLFVVCVVVVIIMLSIMMYNRNNFIIL